MRRLIYADAAIKTIDGLPNCYNGYSDTYDKAYIIGVLEEVPTADAAPIRRGKWIDDNCSECGQYVYSGDMRNYCPCCGAMMEEE